MKRKRLMVSVALLGGVGLGLLGLNRWMNSPAATTTATLASSQAQGVLGSSAELQPFETAYFTTEIPASLRSKTSTENSRGAIMGSYLWGAIKPTLDDQVGVTIGKLGSSTLGELSAVKLRQNNTALYVAAPLEGAPAGALVYRRTDTYETAVFWQQNDRYASVVVSGQQQRAAELDQTVHAILGNWSWR
jgi:hypothetical protein